MQPEPLVAVGLPRCVGGRLYEHRPQHDDPDFEVDVGECPDIEKCGCCWQLPEERGDAA